MTHEGREISLPYEGEGAAGMAKPLRMILHPNPDIPIYLGTGAESTVRLTGEIADGWLPLGFMPGTLDEYRPWLEHGFARAGNGKGFHNFRDRRLAACHPRRRCEGGASRSSSRARRSMSAAWATGTRISTIR